MAATYKAETTFQVVAQSHFSLFDLQNLLRLYQPLIGHQAVALYLSLWSDYLGETRVDTQVELTLQRLVDQQQISLSALHHARQALEAYKLIQTYETRNPSAKLRFVMFNPLPPEQFFKNDLLGLLLLKTLGTVEFQRTQSYYAKAAIIMPDEQNVSIAIDAFRDIPSDVSDEEQSQLQATHEFIGTQASAPESTFNFNELKQFMREYQLTDRLLTPSVRSLISALSVTHRIPPKDMVYLLLSSITGTGLDASINTAKLQQLAKRSDQTYRVPVVTALPSTTPPTPTNPSPIAQKIAQFNYYSPVQFMKFRNDNKEPLDVDKRLILSTQEKTKLADPIMNVLIDYVLLTQGGSLPKAYFEKIAGFLSRNHMSDPEMAMVALENFGTRKSTPYAPTTSRDDSKIETVSAQASGPSDEEIAAILAEQSKRLKRG